MKKLILVGAGLLLATANTPPTYDGAEPEGELSSVVAAESPAADAKPAKPAKAAKPAHVAAAARPAAYPPCSATVRDRCVQGRGYRAAPPRQREIQYAMRAGERG